MLCRGLLRFEMESQFPWTVLPSSHGHGEWLVIGYEKTKHDLEEKRNERKRGTEDVEILTLSSKAIWAYFLSSKLLYRQRNSVENPVQICIQNLQIRLGELGLGWIRIVRNETSFTNACNGEDIIDTFEIRYGARKCRCL